MQLNLPLLFTEKGCSVPSVSHSEVSAYLSCRRQHHYSYTRHLEAVNKSTALGLGTAGHRILEAFYRGVLDIGGSTNLRSQRGAVTRAKELANEEYKKIFAEGYRDADNRQSLKSIISLYFANEPFVARGWKILAVERKYQLIYDEAQDLRFSFVVDLVMQDPDKRYVVADHKFVYEFYTYEEAELMPQIPKYIGAIRALGEQADYGIYNQLRTRPIKVPTVNQGMFQLPFKASSTRVVRSFQEQIDAAAEIQSIKDLTPEDQDRMAWRASSKETCKWCDFKDLCSRELAGENTKLVLKTEYKTREHREFKAD